MGMSSSLGENQCGRCADFVFKATFETTAKNTRTSALLSSLGADHLALKSGPSDDATTEGKHEDPNSAIIAFSLHLGG